MTDTTDNKALSDALSCNYLQATLTVRQWSGKRSDRALADELAMSKHASLGAAAVVKDDKGLCTRLGGPLLVQ